MLILTGGVGVLAKPEDEIADGHTIVRREVAGWTVARLLGWCDVVATTVLREVESFRGAGRVRSSLQVLWSDNLPDAPLDLFPKHDVLRAGVFDAVIGQTDRGGHNWLAVPGTGHAPRPKLVDHGYAFKEDVGPPSSTFFERAGGSLLGDWIIDPLSELRRAAPDSELRALLSPTAFEALITRTKALIEAQSLYL